MVNAEEEINRSSASRTWLSHMYCYSNDSKFLDRQVKANSVKPD